MTRFSTCQLASLFFPLLSHSDAKQTAHLITSQEAEQANGWAAQHVVTSNGEETPARPSIDGLVLLIPPKAIHLA